MTCVTYTELFRCLMRHKYIIDRKSTQFVDDHIQAFIQARRARLKAHKSGR